MPCRRAQPLAEPPYASIAVATPPRITSAATSVTPSEGHHPEGDEQGLPVDPVAQCSAERLHQHQRDECGEHESGRGELARRSPHERAPLVAKQRLHRRSLAWARRLRRGGDGDG